MTVSVDLLHEDVDVADVADAAVRFFRVDIESFKVVRKRMTHDGLVLDDFFDLISEGTLV